MNPKISIIILNWNGWRDTIECLESLYQADYPNYNTIVIDNASKDESIVKIREYCEGKISVKSKIFEYNSKNKPIKVIEYYRKEAIDAKKEEAEKTDCLPSNKKLIIIRNSKNYGYAGGNNIGIRYALKILNSDYILLLNSDTVVCPRILTAFTETIEQFPEAGILGAKIYFYSEPNKIWYAGGKWLESSVGTVHIGREQIDNGRDWEQISDTGYACGCALFVDAKVVKTIGMLEPKYFNMLEDTEWCYRARHAGYRCLFVPRAKVWHKISSAFIGGTGSAHCAYFWWRNKLLWVERNANRHEKIRCYKMVLKQLFCEFRRYLNPKTNTECHLRHKAALYGARDYILRRFGDAPSWLFHGVESIKHFPNH